VLNYRDSRFTLFDSRPALDVLGEIVSWNLFPVLGVHSTRQGPSQAPLRLKVTGEISNPTGKSVSANKAGLFWSRPAR